MKKKKRSGKPEKRSQILDRIFTSGGTTKRGGKNSASNGRKRRNPKKAIEKEKATSALGLFWIRKKGSSLSARRGGERKKRDYWPGGENGTPPLSSQRGEVGGVGKKSPGTAFSLGIEKREGKNELHAA